MTPAEFARSYVKPKAGHVEPFQFFITIFRQFQHKYDQVIWNPWRIRANLESHGYRFGIIDEEVCILNVDTPNRRYVGPHPL